MRRPLVALVVLVALTSACADPPSKEMHQAQGAIDAARAAGAEEYAAEELSAARSLLGQAQEAVAQRDYRLALSQALDASERAQAAARRAATQKAEVRSEAERTLADLTTTVGQLETRLKPLRGVRAQATLVATADATLAAATHSVQEARTAIAEGKYLAARDIVRAQLDRVSGLKTDLDAAIGPRRRR
jgi:hypothetical protein